MASSPSQGRAASACKLRRRGRSCSVRVIDDGVGLKDGLSSGIGLANVREQLDVRYGSEAWLKVAASREGGTVAEIMVPLRTPTA